MCHSGRDLALAVGSCTTPGSHLLFTSYPSIAIARDPKPFYMWSISGLAVSHTPQRNLSPFKIKEAVSLEDLYHFEKNAPISPAPLNPNAKQL